MKTAYNLLWLGLTLRDKKKADEKFITPIPEKTIENIINIASQNPNSDILLWVDSIRLTEEQAQWFKETITKSGISNVKIKDLREIPEYAADAFYKKSEENKEWRIDKHSLIWRQVDAAKVLISLQGDYDQYFYSDTDVTNLKIDSEEIQTKIRESGIVLGGGKFSSGFPWYENQLFGFSKDRINRFRLLYQKTISDVKLETRNGYQTFVDFINNELIKKDGIETRNSVFEVRHDGTFAEHKQELKKFEGSELLSGETQIKRTIR